MKIVKMDTNGLSKEEIEDKMTSNTTKFSEQIKNEKNNNNISLIFIFVCIAFYFMVYLSFNENQYYQHYFILAKDDFTWQGFILNNIMHGNIFHLLMNLFSFGFIMSRLFFINYKYIVLTIIITAISSSFLSYLLMNEHTGVLGSSGIVFGISMFWFLYLINIKFVENNESSLYLKSIVKRNLMINSVLMIGINFLPGIAWYAHLGGALAGISLFYIFKSLNKIDFSPEAVYIMFNKGV